MTDPKITSITKNKIGKIEPAVNSSDGERRLRACEKKWSRRLSMDNNAPKWQTMTNCEEVADYARAITDDLLEEYGEHNVALKTTEMLSHIFAEQGIETLDLSVTALDGIHNFHMNVQLVPDSEPAIIENDLIMKVELPEEATEKDAKEYLDNLLSEKESQSEESKPFIPVVDLSNEDLAELMFSIENKLKQSNDLNLLLFTAGVLSLWREMSKLNASTSTVIFQNLTNNGEAVYEGMKVVIESKTGNLLKAKEIETKKNNATKTVTFGFGHK